MRHLFVSQKIAKQLKEKGFNEPCMKAVKDGEELTGCGFSFANNGNTHDFTLPLFQQVADWFREKKKIYVLVSSFPVHSNKYGISYGRGQLHGGWQPVFENEDTYYGAYSEAITEALKLI